MAVHGFYGHQGFSVLVLHAIVDWNQVFVKRLFEHQCIVFVKSQQIVVAEQHHAIFIGAGQDVHLLLLAVNQGNQVQVGVFILLEQVAVRVDFVQCQFPDLVNVVFMFGKIPFGQVDFGRFGIIGFVKRNGSDCLGMVRF